MTPQECELIAVFRQLGDQARKVMLESVLSARDCEREAEALVQRVRRKPSDGAKFNHSTGA